MTLPPGLETTLFVATCVVVPIVWGWLVNWLFVRYRRRGSSDKPEADAKFSDYQI